jgi:hypothetical protein
MGEPSRTGGPFESSNSEAPALDTTKHWPQRKCLAGLGRLPQRLQRFAGRGDRHGLHAPVAKHLSQDQPIGGVVVDDEHACSPDKHRRPRHSGGGLLGGRLEAGSEMERTATAQLAFGPYPPTHQFG